MGSQGVTTYIGIGTNLGNRMKNIEKALLLMVSKGIAIKRVSTIIETEPYGFSLQPEFLNCVVEAETNLTPRKLLEALLLIEIEMGRIRSVRWGPRVIDLDIIFYGESVILEKDLTIPHRDMHNRAFVLQPMCELAPDFVHPVLERTMCELLEKLERAE